MKKFLAVFLSILLSFSLLLPAAAATDTDPCPLVVVRGMQFTGLYTDLGTENEHMYLERVNAGNIALSIVKAVAMGLLNLSKDAFADSLIDSLLWMFEELACDGNGDSVFPVSALTCPGNFSQYEATADLGDGGEDALIKAACERYGAENVYYFVYDWRLDPYDIAEDIHETVELAKAEHHTDQVNLIACSMGGIMTNAYFYRYGADSVNSCLYLSSTFQGTYCTTDLLQGKAEVNQPALSYLISSRADGAMSLLASVFTNSGLLSLVCALGDRFIDTFQEDIYERFMRPTFATLPSLWAVTLPEELESCLSFVYPTEELQQQYAGVIARARRMGEINASTDEMLREIRAQGCKISVVASYNGSCVPFYARSDSQGDGTLESPLMLGGATMAPVGTTLPDSYVPADPARLSPDRMVDLSTALFPDSTWALKNAPHVPCMLGSQVAELLFDLLDSEVQPTAENMTGYNQFMQADSALNLTAVVA